MSDEFSPDELEIFATARLAGVGLRKTFDDWLVVGRAVQVAYAHADADGGGVKTRGLRFHAILHDQQLDWIARGSEAARLRQVMENLKEVQAWRAGLSDYQRLRWSSPQSVWNRCPHFHPDGKTKGPKVTAKPMTVRQLLHLPSTEGALLLYRRCPSKAFALWRALSELIEAGAVTRPPNGWATQRAQAAAQAAAG
jgi:hypothetical protein